MKLGLYWRYATRSLARGGQRTLLAIFCVAVGVMAIVGLQLVSLSVNAALLDNIVQANSGDLRLRALPVAPVHVPDLARFADLQHSGQITGYATSYDVGGDIALPSGDQIDGNLLAVSPNFPLVGQPHFTLPDATMTLPRALEDNGIAVSSDIFDQLHAQIGDRVQLKVEDGRLLNVRLAAVFVTSGALGPNEIVVAQATLDAAPGPNGAPLPPTFTTVYMTVPAANLSAVVAQLKQQFPAARVITAPDLLRQRQKQVDQLRLFLHLVGLLALFIGGVGIINTMQVMLRRRQIEIAMLKAAGYRQGDLNALFGLEAALLGIMGGIIGAGAGVGASYLVRAVMSRAFFLDLPVILDPLTIISGVVVGLVTALIFGLLPIVRASGERPLAVLREVPEGMERRPWLASAGLLIVLSLLFVIFAAVILGDPLIATLTVYGGALIVFGLGLCFSLLILAIARLPVYERPRGRMALWGIGAVGACAVAIIVAALLAALGGILLRVLGGGIPGVVALILLGGLGIILVGCASVYVLAALGDALIMFAPRAWKTAVMLAYRNLGRQRIRTTTTLTALFVGVFGIGMVVVLGQGIKDAIHTDPSDVELDAWLNEFPPAGPPEQQPTPRAGLPLPTPFALLRQKAPVTPAPVKQKPLLYLCPTCGERTAPDSPYCWSCRQTIALPCRQCGLYLLPIQATCPRCDTPNAHSVRR